MEISGTTSSRRGSRVVTSARRPPADAVRAGVLVALLALSLAACPGTEPEGTSGTATAATEEPTAGAATTQGASASESTSTGGMGVSTASMGDTALDESTTSADTMPTTDTGVMPPVPKSCALADIDPRADPAAVIDAGDGEGQIPTGVGEALLRNCGCHYTDDVPRGYVDYKSNDQPMATLADFHADFTGTFPVDFERMPAYVAVEERVVHSNPLPMPPFGCGVEGEPGKITAADFQLLADWLAAGAPDGASFP